MKKICLSLSVSLVVVMLFTACRNNEKNGEGNAETAPAESMPPSEARAGAPGFEKTLGLQGITFEVRTTGEGSMKKLTIRPKGLKSGDTPIAMDIDGSVANAEIEDLNADGYPELLVYTVSAGSGSYGDVKGFSVLAGQSMVPISFPDLSGNAEAGKGYMGHDEFAIVETSLIRRFPIYREGDPNSSPSGGTRQISYKLEAGENSPVFRLQDISEF